MKAGDEMGWLQVGMRIHHHPHTPTHPVSQARQKFFESRQLIYLRPCVADRRIGSHHLAISYKGIYQDVGSASNVSPPIELVT